MERMEEMEGIMKEMIFEIVTNELKTVIQGADNDKRLTPEDVEKVKARGAALLNLLDTLKKLVDEHEKCPDIRTIVQINMIVFTVFLFSGGMLGEFKEEILELSSRLRKKREVVMKVDQVMQTMFG